MRTLTVFVFLTALLVGCGGTGGGSSAPSTAQVSGALQAIPRAQTLATMPPRIYTLAKTCGIAGCSDALAYLNGVEVGTASYTDGITYFIPGTYAGTVTFLGRTFNDLVVTFAAASANDWTLNGTFSLGHDSLAESFYVYGHSGRGGGTTIVNTGGTITTPYHTASPRPSPSPTAAPTPRPTPTDN